MRGRKWGAASGSLVFLVVAPGVVAGLIPWWITGWEMRPATIWIRIVGMTLIGLSVTALIYSFVRFVIEGIGTPAPVAPTERLVVGGLYRYVRNPMYVAVVAIIIGEALWLGRPVLILYGALMGFAMFSFARWYEEPALAKRFGKSYETYRRNVPGWWPRRTPWSEESGS